MTSASQITAPSAAPRSVVTISPPVSEGARLDYLDAVRAFALVLGVVFHASLSFTPWFMGWAVQDISTGEAVGGFILVCHSFRMEAFFLISGFFTCRVLARSSLGEFVRTRAVRIGVPFVVGWFILRPLIVSGWLMGAASLRGDYQFWASIAAGFQQLRELPAGIFTGTHLWFLYYLAMITALALVVRAVVSLSAATGDELLRQADGVTLGLVRSRWLLPVLVALTAGPLWFMQYWGMDTPDKSLLPNAPVLAVYGGCFLLGWLFARSPGGIEHFSRITPLRCMTAVVAIVVCFALSPIQGDPGHPQYTLARACFMPAYATLMWSLVVLTFGVFRRFCSRPNPAVRYVADSSYWMYLVHLPVVVWLQVAVAEVAVHWVLKLAFISLATVVIVLVTYDLFVRSTFLGAILNGRRRDRAIVRFASPARREGEGTA